MKVIATLPISPRPNAQLGFFTIPVVADVLGIVCDRITLQAINLIGGKANAVESLPDYLGALRALNVRTDRLWVDSENLPTHDLLTSILSQGIRDRWLTQEDINVWLCECGKTEILDEAESLSQPAFHASTYYLEAGKPICRLCMLPASQKERRRLLLHLPNLDAELIAEPAYAASELRALQVQFAGRKLSVSRERETGLVFCSGDGEYHLDPDLAWMLFPALAASSFNCSIETIVTGHKTLKHSLIAILASRLVC